MIKTVRLSDNEIEWLESFDDNFHKAIAIIKTESVTNINNKVILKSFDDAVEEIKGTIETEIRDLNPN